ncbi:MAG: hypothetical protein WBM40_13165 [Thiohalocapsa sp.]
MLEHTAVAHARVYIASDVAGTRLAADVVSVGLDSDAVPSTGEFAAELSAWLPTRLFGAELPRPLRIVAGSIPSTDPAGG